MVLFQLKFKTKLFLFGICQVPRFIPSLTYRVGLSQVEIKWINFSLHILAAVGGFLCVVAGYRLFLLSRFTVWTFFLVFSILIGSQWILGRLHYWICYLSSDARYSNHASGFLFFSFCSLLVCSISSFPFFSFLQFSFFNRLIYLS